MIITHKVTLLCPQVVAKTILSQVSPGFVLYFWQSVDQSRCGKTTDHLSLVLLTMAVTTITVTLSVITSDSRHLQVQCGCVVQQQIFQLPWTHIQIFLCFEQNQFVTDRYEIYWEYQGLNMTSHNTITYSQTKILGHILCCVYFELKVHNIKEVVTLHITL